MHCRDEFKDENVTFGEGMGPFVATHRGTAYHCGGDGSDDLPSANCVYSAQESEELFTTTNGGLVAYQCDACSAACGKMGQDGSSAGFSELVEE